MSALADGASAEAQADALWAACLAHGGADGGTKRSFPTHPAVMSEIMAADYSSLLRCPADARSAHPYGAKNPARSLCAHGALARCRVEFFSNEYTGLFGGAPHCLVRLSTAVAPATGVGAYLLGKIKDAKLFPCVAVKALRGRGKASGNLLFAGAKTGHASTDFFAHGVSTHLTKKLPVALKHMLRYFSKYTPHPLSLGISDWAASDADGAVPDAPDFPWCLALSPVARLPPLPPSAGHDAFLDALLTLEAGTHLYDVYAVPSPARLAATDPPPLERVGRLVTTSKMVPSPPGSPVVFKHQAKEEDYALRPGWVPELSAKVVCHDGKPGTADANCGSKLLDAHVAAGRYVDREPDASRIRAS